MRTVGYGGSSFSNGGGEAGATRRMRVSTLPRSFTTTSSSMEPEAHDDDLSFDQPVHRSPRVLSGQSTGPYGRRTRRPLNSTGSMQDTLHADDAAFHSEPVNGREDVDTSSPPVPPNQKSPRGHSAPPESSMVYASSNSGSESLSSSRGSPVTPVQSRSPSRSARSSLSPPPPVAPKPRRSSVGSKSSSPSSGTRITATSVQVQAKNKKAEPNDRGTSTTFLSSFPSAEISEGDLDQFHSGMEATNVPQSAGSQVTTTSTNEVQLSTTVDNNVSKTRTEEGRGEEAVEKKSLNLEVKPGPNQKEVIDQCLERKDTSTDAGSMTNQLKNVTTDTKEPIREASGPEVKSVPVKSVATSSRNRSQQDNNMASGIKDGFLTRDSLPKDDKADDSRMQSKEGSQRRGHSEPPESLPKSHKRTPSESRIHIVVSSSVDKSKTAKYESKWQEEKGVGKGEGDSGSTKALNEEQTHRIKELEKALKEKEEQLAQSKKDSSAKEEQAQKIRELEAKLERAERILERRRTSSNEDHSFKVRELEDRLQKREKEIADMTEDHALKIKELQILLREKEEDLSRCQRQHERKLKEKEEEAKKIGKENKKLGREKWELLKRCKESAERSLYLRTQLDMKETSTRGMQNELERTKHELTSVKSANTSLRALLSELRTPKTTSDAAVQVNIIGTLRRNRSMELAFNQGGELDHQEQGESTAAAALSSEALTRNNNIQRESEFRRSNEFRHSSEYRRSIEFQRSSDFRLSTSSLGPNWPDHGSWDREGSVESSSLFDESSETASVSSTASKSQPISLREAKKNKKKKFVLPKIRRTSTGPKRGNSVTSMGELTPTEVLPSN